MDTYYRIIINIATFLTSLTISATILFAISKLTREKRIRMVIIYASLLFGTTATLDFYGIYATVPISSFLMIYGAYLLIRERKSINIRPLLDVGIIIIAISYALNIIDSWDVNTYYAPQAYYVIAHDSRFYPLDISNAIAVGLYASVGRIYALLGLRHMYARAMLAWGFLTFYALYDFIRDVLEADKYQRILLMFSVPYRLIQYALKPGYIDRLFALITITFFKSIRAKDNRLLRISLTIYVISKQSRPALLIPAALAFFPRYVVLLAGLIMATYVIHKSLELFILVSPAFFTYAIYSLRLERLRINPLEYLDKNVLRTLPTALVMIRNTIIFGWPLGATELSIAEKLGLIKQWVIEGSERLSVYSMPTVMIYRLTVLLAAYLTMKTIAIIQSRSAAFLVRGRGYLIRALSGYIVFRSLFSIPLPRQAIAYWVLAMVSISYFEGAWLLRIPLLGTRIYALFYEPPRLKRDLGLLMKYVGIYFLAVIVIFVVFVALERLLKKPLRVNNKVKYGFLLIVLITSAYVTLYKSEMYVEKYNYYSDMKEAAARLLENYDYGSILTTFTTGYIDVYLLPQFRLYQIARIYEYPIIKPLLDAERLDDLVQYLAYLGIKAFIYPDATYSIYINKITRTFLKSGHLVSYLLLSDAFYFKQVGIINILALKDLYKPLYFVYYAYGDLVHYGCGLVSQRDNSIATLELGLLSYDEIISVRAKIHVMLYEQLWIDGSIQYNGSLAKVFFYLPMLNVRFAEIHVETTSGEYVYFISL